jgi:hypothetical protein
MVVSGSGSGSEVDSLKLHPPRGIHPGDDRLQSYPQDTNMLAGGKIRNRISNLKSEIQLPIPNLRRAGKGVISGGLFPRLKSEELPKGNPARLLSQSLQYLLPQVGVLLP